MFRERFLGTVVNRRAMYADQQHSDHGIHLGSLLLGVAAGVAGTLLFATYNERSFRKAVDKTRELSDRAEDYVGNVTGNMRQRAGSMMESAQHGIESAGQKVREVVDNATHKVEEVAQNVTDKTKGNRAVTG